jgi:hypothetical protein
MKDTASMTYTQIGKATPVNTSGKAGAQIFHLPLGDDSSPSGDNTVCI